jgi:ribosomal protein S18 acetylase RimI-like enzyme
VTTEAIRVRDARDDERDAIRALTERSYAEYATIMAPAAWRGLSQAVRSALASDSPAEWIVAERDGALVGSVMLYPPAEDAYQGLARRTAWPELRLLAVPPESRGLGIARLLVDECVRRARKAGAKELGLHTSESMQAAMRLYERLGFERAPEYDFQPEGAELVQAFRRSLRDAE